MFKNRQELLEDYASLQKDNQEKVGILKKQVSMQSYLRVSVFLIEIAFFVAFVSVEITFLQYLFGFGLVIPIIAFAFIVKKQSRLERNLLFQKNMLWVVENEIAAISTGVNGYSNGVNYTDENHSYTSDLDVFGVSSLYSKINRVSTNSGMDLLASWLRKPADKKTILDRQVAVKELKSVTKDSFKFRALLKSQKAGSLEMIIAKVKDKLPKEVTFTRNSTLRFYVKLVPFLMLGLLGLSVFLDGSIGYLLLLLGLINLIIVYSFSKKVQTIHVGFSGFAGNLEDFSEAISWTEQQKWKSAYLHKFFEGGVQNTEVSGQIKELAAIIGQFDARMNMIMNVILNTFFLWDLKCAIKLDVWYSKYSTSIVEGLLRIPKFETIISLGTLSYNYPGWTFPMVGDEFKLAMEDMAHPLIDENIVVKNNYNMEMPCVDIITGSNMAGKSTFLRSVGLNMVLAYAGAPVAAKNMQLSVVKILTYMRIKDALNTNTSTFKAELNRLKLILQEISGLQPSIVLIDEMLRGTNSGDKYEGSKAFIQRMVDLKVPTLFATHDLQLSEMEANSTGKIKNHHFDIYISADEMRFDYLLKDGPCNVFNAAVLLREIGL